MDVSTRGRIALPRGSSSSSEHRWLGIALIALGLGLIANSLLGPLIFDAVDYPWSGTMRNQAIGLEAVSLLLVAPLSILAGVLVLRGHRVGPFVAFGPAAYTAYMFLQYVIGPEYVYYAGVLPLHLAMFILGAGIGVAAWTAMDTSRGSEMARRSERRYGVLLLVLAAFILSRWLPALFAGLAGDPLAAEFRDDVSMYWSIFLLDLGVVVPATIASAVALLRGVPWGPKALYAVFGWFALVPPSVAAMGIAMVANDDSNASAGQAVVLAIVAVVFAVLAIRVFRPLFADASDERALVAVTAPSEDERRVRERRDRHESRWRDEPMTRSMLDGIACGAEGRSSHVISMTPARRNGVVAEQHGHAGRLAEEGATMRAVVVYESMYGNTAEVAKAIATTLRANGVEVETGPVTEIVPANVAEVDLLVVGGPTHAHGMSRPSTRRTAVDDKKNTYAEPTATPGLREWMDGLPSEAERLAAAFDTRIDKPAFLTGSAAKGIARRLKHHGYRLIVGPESFLVSTNNRLLEGETEHATTWGAELAERATTGASSADPRGRVKAWAEGRG